MSEEHAFPVSDGSRPGMTLREYFAAHAPPSPADWTINLAEGETKADREAAWAWQYAEAMMTRRADRKFINQMERHMV